VQFVGSYYVDTHTYKDKLKLYLYIRILLRGHLILSLERLSSTPYTILRTNCVLRPVVFSSLSNMYSVSHYSFLYNTLIIFWRCRNLNSHLVSLDIRQSTDVSVPTGFLRSVFITWRIFLQHFVGELYVLPSKRSFRPTFNYVFMFVIFY
jgi:hypothetical protein